MASKLISLAELDLNSQCSESFEFQVDDADGKPTDIYISVLGEHAPSVQKWVNKQLNARRRQEALQEKRGKKVDARNIEDDIEFGAEMMSKRIVGWRGITEDFSPDFALQLCMSNASITNQVREHSEDMGNFTAKK